MSPLSDLTDETSVRSQQSYSRGGPHYYLVLLFHLPSDNQCAAIIPVNIHTWLIALNRWNLVALLV